METSTILDPADVRKGSWLIGPTGLFEVNFFGDFDEYDYPDNGAPIICGSTFKINGYEIDECRPIPLSPAVLEACGLSKHKYHECGYFYPNGCAVFVVSRDGEWWRINNAMLRVKFLHELQNFYRLAEFEMPINAAQLAEAVKGGGE